MWDVLAWLAIALVVAALGAGAAYLARGGLPSALTRGFFKPKVEPRIEVVEYAAMDGKRRLVLIRRDDIEHLLLTGGPVDVVIETGIVGAAERALDTQMTPTATAAQSPFRGFGQRAAIEPASIQPPPLSRPATGIVNRANEPELPSLETADPRVERSGSA